MNKLENVDYNKQFNAAVSSFLVTHYDANIGKYSDQGSIIYDNIEKPIRLKIKKNKTRKR